MNHTLTTLMETNKKLTADNARLKAKSMSIKKLKTLVRAASLRQLQLMPNTDPFLDHFQTKLARCSCAARREALLAVLEACDSNDSGNNATLLQKLAE